MADVFISYKAEEIEDANWVKQTLENNGISCWMAPMSIPGGSSYAVEIPQAIQACKVFVLILSKKTQASKWVPKEIDQAINFNKTIMPFMLEDCALQDDFNFYLTNVQRYAAYESKAAAIEKMINEIRALIGTTVPSAPPTLPTPPTVPEKKPENAKSKTKFIITIAAAVVAVALIVGIILIVANGGSKDSNDAKGTDTEVSSEEVVMSDELFDFTFTLEGVVYKLPCRYEDLTGNGWTISSDGTSSDKKIAGQEYELFTMSKDGRKITVYSYNFSGNVKMVKECPIGGIECCASNNVDLTIAKGITVNSTSEEIKNAFGTPGDTYIGDEYEKITYYVQKNSYYNSVEFYCYADGKYSSLRLKNFVETSDANTDTNKEKPDYLGEYKAPDSMGADLKSAVVKVEGDLYQLPAPVSAFTDNGWKIVQQSGDVVAGGSDYIRVEKDGKKLDLSIANFAEYQTTVENCAVYKVYTDDYGKANVTIGSDAKPVSMGSAKADVDAAVVDGMDCTDASYSYKYYYSEYKERDFAVSICVAKDTGKVNNISVSCKNWEY